MRLPILLPLLLFTGCGSPPSNKSTGREHDLPSTPVYTVSVSVAGSGGTVACVNTVEVPYAPSKLTSAGQPVTVIAAPDSGMAVGEWDGTDDDTLTTNDNTVTPQTGDKSATVAFLPVGSG